MLHIYFIKFFSRMLLLCESRPAADVN